MDVLSVHSFAKINLGLRILRKREDGYHDIQTVFQEIDLHDDLDFEKYPSGIAISSSHPDLPLDSRNLVHRAFGLFCERAKIREGLSVHIEKHIPMGAGLGGGSSNAAALLIAANRLWGNPLSSTQLEEVAAEIGSDVPFFLIGGTALGEGRGESLTPINGPKGCWVCLVYPGVPVSTEWAYREVKIALTNEPKMVKFNTIFKNLDSHTLRTTLVNDFEGVVFSRHPFLAALKAQMSEKGAFYASMSGSGSTIFGLFKNRETAEKARAFFSIDHRMASFLCRPVPPHRLTENIGLDSLPHPSPL
jgi:4-diphosphocytidyl-2-C-methyl-D-erythritol kinase